MFKPTCQQTIVGFLFGCQNPFLFLYKSGNVDNFPLAAAAAAAAAAADADTILHIMSRECNLSRGVLAE